MSSGLLVALEITLVLGGLLALAVWELLRLRRDRKAPSPSPPPPPPARPPAPSADQPQ